MKISGAVLVVLGCVLALVLGSYNGLAQELRPPGMGCKARFAQMDKNKDGKVTLKEFIAVPHPEGNPERIFRLLDTNKDGVLTLQEYCGGKQKKKTQETTEEEVPPTSP